MKILKFTIPFGIIFLMWICCNFASEISQSIRDSINTCLVAIFPSMYGFMIVSDLFVKTNSHRFIGKILSPFSRYILHLDGKLFAIFLISLVAGYPVGAKLISTLEKNNSIDSHLAQNMYCYCYSGGLAFIMGTIGTGFNNGFKIALIIYISNVISNLILAIILNLKSKIPNKDTSKIEINLNSNILIDSINSSFKVMLNICVMIISFGILISLLNILNIGNGFSILNAILEISHTSQVRIVGKYYLPILAMLFSFGGLCVILQIVSISGKSFNLIKFLKFRILTAGLSFGICYILSKIFLKDYLMVISNYSTKISNESSIIPTICLMFMSFILLSQSTKSEKF